MSRPKPPPVPLHEMTAGQQGDFFALLAEKTPNQTRDGKPFFTCRFKDARRTVTFMVWADSPWFETCDREWQAGAFYKIRGVFQEHKQYGPQIDIHNIRPVNDGDTAHGFDPRNFV